ncbi:MAG: virulence RhuM family protein [Bacteroidales bacterium]|nr:virulence RhuM family protein [Bacteroidales bacterium]
MLTQNQLAEFYDTTKQNVGQHIKNILQDGELDQAATVKNFFTVQTEGKRQVEREIEYYNLDMIVFLGYRINSKVATRFRIWATTRLTEYIKKGFTMDDERLKNLDGGSYWRELLDRILYY